MEVDGGIKFEDPTCPFAAESFPTRFGGVLIIDDDGDSPPAAADGCGIAVGDVDNLPTYALPRLALAPLALAPNPKECSDMFECALL